MGETRVWRSGLAPAAIAALIFSSGVSAQGWIEPLPGRTDPGVVKVRTSVSVRVADRVAHVEVEEWFRNDGGQRFGEGDYLYPLPGEAVFSNFSLFQGDQELRGETMNADEARRIYEDIVRRKKDPALIELVGHGMVRARVFPINAGETRKITLRYTQVLARAGDALQFRYTAGGRFAGILPDGREHAQGPQRRVETAPLAFTLTAEDGELFNDAFSPTHAVRVTRERGRMVVRPDGELRGDFALFLPFADRPIGIALATHRVSGEDGYFMLTLSPRAAAASRVPRDVTAIVDVSGSMSGEKIDQARRALTQLLGTLDSNDRFRLISFSSTVRTYRADWTRATSQEIERAQEWVDALAAEGGTNISGALDEAFRLSSPEPRLPVVLFMTDGLPSVGERNPEHIARMAEQARGRSRVFAVGVGHDVNTYLLDRLGAAGRGGAQYVQPGEDVEQAVSTLAARVRHPVLASLRLAHSPVRLEEIYPRELPDLFADDELVIFGRYAAGRSDAQGRLAIEGTRSGRSELYETSVTFPEHEDGNDYIPRLWASRKLGFIQQEIRLSGPTPELVEEIKRLALRYGLLSEYTSYLVQEPELVAGAVRREDRAFTDLAANAGVQRGQAAVAAAEASRRARDVRSSADLDRAQKSVALPAAPLGNRPGESETLAGRIFRREGVEWVDAMHRSSARITDIAPFSPAYFALLERLPELKPYWKQYDAVLVAGRDLSIRLRSDGAAQLSRAELDRLVESFRVR
ncbi:MAG: VIT and VWA domain-containing protein [Gemmatimonadetes bacterium]|nr:VIT and VWA domain-containing protein [Gemmatimonadota bacterium]